MTSDPGSASGLQPTIGIECHVQLSSVSKLFSGASNDDRDTEPNTLVNHIDFGLPGALPVFNSVAMELATRAALALNTRPELFSKFDRKHYFYPDLPMGYQITQYDQPVIAGGYLKFEVDSVVKQVGITRAHLEADAGKSTHPAGTDFSLVDLNRAGTPLLEIVSEPEMHSAKEAKNYCHELYLLMRYAGVTHGDLYHGNMRFDVNVSVSLGPELGVRTETKNLNSFRAVEKAVEFEIKRQREVLSSGGAIVQETRGWNDAKQKTFSQRSKENADDYRYMPDPDLPPVQIESEYIDSIAKLMPPGPAYWRESLSKIGLNKSQIETLLEANLELSAAGYLKLISAYESEGKDTLQLANWLVNIDIPLVRGSEGGLSEGRSAIYQAVSVLVALNKLSSTNAKELITRLLKEKSLPESVESYADQKGLLQQSDAAEIAAMVEAVLRDNPAAVSDIRRGEAKAIGFLVGQVMAKSKGQANPSLARELIEKQIGGTEAVG